MNQPKPNLSKTFYLIPLVNVALLITAATASAQPYVFSRTFDDPTPTQMDHFGISGALDGNRVLIGAVGDNTNGAYVGQAHLFNATTGSLLQTFDDPTITDRDFFGLSVALVGNRALIGADGDDTNGDHVGQAHLFDTTTGNLLRTFDDPDAVSQARFGIKVALDGNHVLVGRSPAQPPYDGKAFLFDATTGDLLWTFDDPTPSVNSSGFGRVLALDGNHILLGEKNDRTNGAGAGQAHLFDATTGNLLRTFDDPTMTGPGEFGKSVAVDGNRVLIGEHRDDTNGHNVGQAHLFDATTGSLLHTFDDPTPTYRDLFGNKVALDGNHVLIGAIWDDTNGDQVGQAHLFDATTGSLLQTFDDPTITSRDHFGIFVELDGNRVLIGAYRDDTNGFEVGQAHLFEVVTNPDFNDDELIDCVDVDSLVMEIVAGTHDPTFDLTVDGFVDTADLDQWRVQGGEANLPSGNPYLEGDANLDGEVDGLDFITWNANKFISQAAWCSGDFNADGLIGGLDFILWNANKFMSADGVNAVPEPGTTVWSVLALILVAVPRVRR